MKARILMPLLQYGSLLVAQLGTTVKQFSMKKCGAIAPGPFQSVCINTIRVTVCFFVSLMLWLIADGQGSTLTGNLIAVASGVGTALSLFCWILASGLVSLTLLEAVITLATTVAPLVLAPFLYNGETPTLLQWLGCLLICASLCFFMKPAPKKEEQKKRRTLSGAIAAVLILAGAAVGVASAMILKKYYTFHVTEGGLGSAEYFTLIQFAGALGFFALLIVPLYFAEKRRLASTSDEMQPAPRVIFPIGRLWPYILMAAVALYVNELFTVYASTLPSALFYLLTKSLTILCTFFMDLFLYRERFTWKRAVGLVLVLAAVVLVNL